MACSTARAGNSSLGAGGLLAGGVGTGSRRTTHADCFAARLQLDRGAFVIASVWFKEPIEVAILVAGLASLIWYILAMYCLWTLRRRLPEIFDRYRTPLVKTLPLVVIAISAFAILGYTGKKEAAWVLTLTAVLYLVGLGYFALWGRHRLHAIAPRDPAGQPGLLARGEATSMNPDKLPRDDATLSPGGNTILNWCTVGVLWVTLLVLGWIVVAAYRPQEARFASDEVETVLVLALIGVALILVCLVAWLHTRPRPEAPAPPSEAYHETGKIGLRVGVVALPRQIHARGGITNDRGDEPGTDG